ncbi:metalloendoproteinase 2-MMP-like [Prosopis cineraria]|uniref:metalloendoproteinase 2-MMP-like n=1 Tax=Prosopis cineraria TaxID=364024 RepID=UPI00240FFCE4|nr:metalloendoproteinase 2-MMP-like [Prosopis cineraria]
MAPPLCWTIARRRLPSGGRTGRKISYAFSPEVKTSTSFKDAFADAFQWWSNKTTLNFTEMTSFNEADIQIMFLPLDGNLGVVGGAWFDNKTKKWNVVLDSDEKWVVQTEDMKKSDDLYLEPEVIHQIGHVLGLNHSAIKQDNMNPLIQTQSSDGGGGGGVGLRWGLVSTLWLGVTLLFWL